MNKELLRVAIKAAKSSSQLILANFNKPHVVKFKGQTDLVTGTDKQSEKIIVKEILSHFPNHGILAEESVYQAKHSKYLWIIDPPDGTTNFVHGYPSFGVSIACSFNHEIIVAVVLELPSYNIYTAIKNIGSYKNGKSIKVSKVNTLNNSLLVTGFGYNHDTNWEKSMKLFKHFTNITQGVRRLGAASVDLCHLASGVVDGFWEFDLKPWDISAGYLIVKEAGGFITKLDGTDFSIFDNQILATNKKIHNDIILNIDKQINL